MAPPNSIRIIETYHVQPMPSHDSPELSVSELSLPLTIFDLFHLKLPTVQRLFFYQQPVADSTFFNSVVVPKLNHSLSQTLVHFLPAAGRLTWPDHSPKPFILYSPNDGVSVVVTESNADFHRLSNNNCALDVSESESHVPKLSIDESEASILALQINLFPNKGFSIGYSYNHAVFDGKSMSMFMKAWAHICKSSIGENKSPCPLPDELTPSFDRTATKDPFGLETLFFTKWIGSMKNFRSLKPSQLIPLHKMVRSTFKLTNKDINNLKEKASVELLNDNIRLSTFAVACAYALVCMVKARSGDANRTICFSFAVDYRTRLDASVPINYLGNCIFPHRMIAVARDFMEENGFSAIAGRIGGVIEGLDKRLFEDIENTIFNARALESADHLILSAGSPRFGVYGVDFGWGKPRKVEFAVPTSKCFSLTDSRCGSGVEIGLSLPRDEMEAFSSFFIDGLKIL